MKTFLALLQALALSGVIVVCCAAVYTLNILTGKSSATLENLNRTTIIIGGAATNFEKASRTWQAASESQVQASTQFLKKTNAAMESLDAMVRRTDSNVNDILIPSVAAAVERQDKSLLQVEGSLDKAATELRFAIADTDQQITNPAISKSLANLAQASGEANQSLVQVNAIATDGRVVADKFREDYLRPQKFAWVLFKQAVGLGGSFAQMVK